MRTILLATLFTGYLLGSVLCAANSPVALSPGDPNSPASMGIRCPTFTWSPGDGELELQVHRLPLKPSPSGIRSTIRHSLPPRIRITLPEGTTAWSTSGRSCLEPGSYAWTIGPAKGAPEEWSEPLLIEIEQHPARRDEALTHHQSSVTDYRAPTPEDSNPAPASSSDRSSASLATVVLPPNGNSVSIDGQGNAFAGAFIRICEYGSPFFLDADNDGYGDPNEEISACGAVGYVTDNTDCDDNHPKKGATEDTDQLCADGVDNDCDSWVDCADFDCGLTVPCCGVPTPENTAATCADGVDNDCDSWVDCNDFGCSAFCP